MSQPNIFRVDTACGSDASRTFYVASPSLGDVQRVVFGTSAHVAMVLRSFHGETDFRLPEDDATLRDVCGA